MNGRWKENIGGWNHKDSKRKAQTRKNTLRDKARVLIHSVDKRKNIDIWEESDIEIIEEKVNYKQSDFYEVWSVNTGDYYDDKRSKSFYAIEYNGKWFDYITYDEMDRHIYKLNFIKKEEFELDIPREEYKNYPYWNRANTNSTTFLYGSPIYDWRILTFYNDGKRRKIAQKMASRKDRQNIRQWINNEDWFSEIKTHYLSKSIAWEIN